MSKTTNLIYSCIRENDVKLRLFDPALGNSWNGQVKASEFMQTDTYLQTLQLYTTFTAGEQYNIQFYLTKPNETPRLEIDIGLTAEDDELQVSLHNFPLALIKVSPNETIDVQIASSNVFAAGFNSKVNEINDLGFNLIAAEANPNTWSNIDHVVEVNNVLINGSVNSTEISNSDFTISSLSVLMSCSPPYSTYNLRVVSGSKSVNFNAGGGPEDCYDGKAKMREFIFLEPMKIIKGENIEVHLLGPAGGNYLAGSNAAGDLGFEIVYC